MGRRRDQYYLCVCLYGNLKHPISPFSAASFYFHLKGKNSICPAPFAVTLENACIKTVGKTCFRRWFSHHHYFTSFMFIPSMLIHIISPAWLQCLWLAFRYFILIYFHSSLFFLLYLHYLLTLCFLYCLSLCLACSPGQFFLLSIPQLCPLSTSFQLKAISPQVGKRRILLLKHTGELSPTSWQWVVYRFPHLRTEHSYRLGHCDFASPPCWWKDLP